ncbi:Acyl-CoA dehydrogenase [Streptomyces sp. DvalAA-14]|uniref:acyl-CoA dehydrogenase family protein n=1 Tax=unclassified Streptomyces TaxID=2593676 RepID=UPI00081BBD9C|nr:MULTISPECIES: acyl-CoA dehydrogenase family protein [unclassified Streptomyces]MYS19200.1 acyl-CoA dehydrogenase [Streptomyces sp. SID4948]SCD38983.1 Acyl-CoA dehydrogenase [Streptomyces sp. DvalAA-14]
MTAPTASSATGAASAPVNLLYTDVEDDLRAAVRSVLAHRCPPAAVLGRIESAEPYDPGLWRVLAAELGLAGLLVPEKLGGQGASAREAAVVLEELGAAVAPTPFLGSAVLATSALLRCDTQEAGVAALLGRLAAGTAAAALAVPLSMAPGDPFPGGVRADADGRLTGTATSVADAFAADVLVVPAVGPEGPGLYEVAASAAVIGRFGALDLTRPPVDVRFEAAAGRRLAAADPVAALDSALLTGAGLLASEQLGVAQWCLDETVRYLGERRQFGRVVGSFQALKHRLADLWLEVVSARAAARAAADAVAGGSPDAAVAVRVAQAYVSGVAVRAAEEAVQLHGGIGMTWEHPLHLYLKRAKADAIALGTPGRHRAALAGLVDLAPAQV